MCGLYLCLPKESPAHDELSEKDVSKETSFLV
jgi:hypothetical protein